VEWQKLHDYPLTFACEATLNIAKQTEVLELMRAARFDTVFVGIETPEINALKSIGKKHNATVPMAEAIQMLNHYGLEVVSGIILGLDSDTADTETNLKEFIDCSNISMLTVNLLQALPRTPLWDRLARAGRLVTDSSRESNVRFLRPYDEVVSTWKRCIAHAYDPDRLYARFIHQFRATYPNRLATTGRRRLTRANVKRGLTLLVNLLVRVGMLANYRRALWRTARVAIDCGEFPSLLSVGFVSYHLIEFTREALRGRQNASFYSARLRESAR
jgi:hopanoid C-2 methylase